MTAIELLLFCAADEAYGDGRPRGRLNLAQLRACRWVIARRKYEPGGTP